MAKNRRMVICELEDVFDNAKEVVIYNDGNVCGYPAGGKAFEDIIVSWDCLLDGAHLMPAFGVSLNRETVKAKNKGLWAEFVFDTEYECGGLDFEKLLVRVESDSQGFNIIRYTKNRGYDGRCYYYDLVGKNMAEFYDLLCNL